MDSHQSQSSSFLHLLNSQQQPTNENPTQFISFQPSLDLGGSGSRAEIGEDRKQRSKWPTAEDLVFISAWLNTSKDAVVRNEQRAGTFWLRITSYYNASPMVVGLAKREQNKCKQRWGKIMKVSASVGCYDAATKQRTSGQSEDDVLKAAHEIFFNDYKVKFTLEHAWRELRNDQKWLGTYGSTQQSSGSKRKRVGEEQTFNSSSSMPSVNGENETRPVGVKAAKAATTKGKRSLVDEGKNLQQVLALKQEVNKIKLLDSLLSRTEPLTELEVALKDKLITECYLLSWLSRDDRKHRLYALEWKNCPTAWKEQYSHGSGKPTIVLEAVASFDLWIWHAFFGPPGTLNDINVFDRSPVFDDIINGQVPNVTFFVNGREYHMAYYLTDGKYPKWTTFIQSIPLPQELEAVLFAKKQEAARKDVERAFGVLQARFSIVKNPALFWDKVKIGNIMRACIILHNMIVEDERDGYTQYDLAGFNEREDTGTSHVDLNFSSHMPTHITEMMEARNDIRDRQMHQQLKDDLVQNI
uniref:Myb-like domain-containing protein n=1 Tax=Brassica oleracea var. oleracea TaxID=109376 RepID=A0A0D3E5D8_BRAOL